MKIRRILILFLSAAFLSTGQYADAQILRALAEGRTDTGTTEDGTRKMIAQWLEANPDIAFDGGMGSYTRRLVKAEALPLSLEELPAYTRVRSIQIDGTGLYSYDYFACTLTSEGDGIRFRKLKGSQLMSGMINPLSTKCLSFDGCWFIKGDKELYDDAHCETGLITKVSRHKIILTIPREEGAYEILEFAKENGPAAFTVEDEKGYLYSFTANADGDEELVLETGGDYDGDIVVPESLEVDGVTVPVTTIRRGAMWKKEGAGNIGTITSVTLPPSVWLVGGDAFRGNHSLKKVVCSSMTRIENRAFFDCPQLELESKPLKPMFAFTDPRVKTSALKELTAPCDSTNEELENYHWAFFKQNHNTIDFSRWKSQDVEGAFACFCYDMNIVKGMNCKFRNPKLVEELFKGYLNESGHYLILADNAFVATHDFPAFSRWIWGEKEKSMPSAFAAQMSAKFGREVRSCCEVGKVTVTKDQLALTEFKVKDSQACFALSWLKDGKEVCTYAQTTETEEETSVWNVDDDGRWGIPHILTIAYGEKGEVEIFLTHSAPESITFMHLKQNGAKLELAGKESFYVYVDSPQPQIQARMSDVLAAWCGNTAPKRYALYDIDGDGTGELFLSDAEGRRIEAYTVKNGQLDLMGCSQPAMRIWFEAGKGYLFMVSSQPGESEMQAVRLENSTAKVKYLKYYNPETQKVSSACIIDEAHPNGMDVPYATIEEHFTQDRTFIHELLLDRWYEL